MIWDDTGFLLSKNKYNENSLIVNFLQKSCSYGYYIWRDFKKIKNFQIGNGYI